MKRTKMLLLTLSLILGFTGTCTFARYLPEVQPVKMTQQAWWGGLYPEYCLPGAMKLVDGEEPNSKKPDKGRTQDAKGTDSGEAEIPVKIRFKYLTFLNDCGGNHE